MIERYTNVWGEEILRVKGESIIINPNLNKLGTKMALGGHVALEGYYNIDEDGNEVFASNDFEEYIRIEGKVRLMEKVHKVFKNRDFNLTVGPNNSVVIDDLNIVPDCYWDLPKKADELENKSRVIIDKVKAFIDMDITEQDVKNLEECIIATVCNLDVSYLSELEESVLYSWSFKDELIIEFAKLFKKSLLKGVTSLYMKKSKCLYCYPDLNAFSFYIKDSEEFVVRCVIGKDSKENKYIVEECKNKKINDDFFKFTNNK